MTKAVIKRLRQIHGHEPDVLALLDRLSAPSGSDIAERFKPLLNRLWLAGSENHAHHHGDRDDEEFEDDTEAAEAAILEAIALLQREIERLQHREREMHRDTQRAFARTSEANGAKFAAKAKLARLRAALLELLYEHEGRWFIGRHGDTDVTNIVGEVLTETKES